MSIPDENAADEYAQAQLAGRMRLVREIEQRIEDRKKSEPKLTRRETVFVGLILGGLILLWLVWTGTWPIPRGKQNREQAAEFLKREFPDRKLTPDLKESSTAPVAALFHVIRHGEPEEAARAIAFAGEQDYGYASPYVIERLESDNPRLRTAARSYLRKMSGADLGPRAAAWRSWWRDPPRKLLWIVPVGHNSFHIAIPVTALLAGVFLLTTNRRGRDVVGALGGALLMGGWLILLGTLGLHLVGGFNTCDFGGTPITYWTNHGNVLGLEDARVGGFGLWLLLVAGYAVGPVLATFAWFFFASESLDEAPPPSAGEE